VLQNACLRVVTGYHKKAKMSHIHRECKELMLGTHLDLLCSQFLASAMSPLHPSHDLVTTPQGPRDMKKSLYSHSIDSIRHHLIDDTISDGRVKQVVKDIHTKVVAAKQSA
jgi:hypothetical protein